MVYVDTKCLRLWIKKRLNTFAQIHSDDVYNLLWERDALEENSNFRWTWDSRKVTHICSGIMRMTVFLVD